MRENEEMKQAADMSEKAETTQKKYVRLPEEYARQALSILNNLTIRGADADKIVMLKSIFASAESEGK